MGKATGGNSHTEMRGQIGTLGAIPAPQPMTSDQDVADYLARAKHLLPRLNAKTIAAISRSSASNFNCISLSHCSFLHLASLSSLRLCSEVSNSFRYLPPGFSAGVESTGVASPLLSLSPLVWALCSWCLACMSLQELLSSHSDTG